MTDDPSSRPRRRVASSVREIGATRGCRHFAGAPVVVSRRDEQPAVNGAAEIAGIAVIQKKPAKWQRMRVLTFWQQIARIAEKPRAMTASQSSQRQKACRQSRRCRTSDSAAQIQYLGERAKNPSPSVPALLSLSHASVPPTLKTACGNSGKVGNYSICCAERRGRLNAVADGPCLPSHEPGAS